jgi:hypothetical protein
MGNRDCNMEEAPRPATRRVGVGAMGVVMPNWQEFLQQRAKTRLRLDRVMSDLVASEIALNADAYAGDPAAALLEDAQAAAGAGAAVADVGPIKVEEVVVVAAPAANPAVVTLPHAVAAGTLLARQTAKPHRHKGLFWLAARDTPAGAATIPALAFERVPLAPGPHIVRVVPGGPVNLDAAAVQPATVPPEVARTPLDLPRVLVTFAGPEDRLLGAVVTPELTVVRPAGAAFPAVQALQVVVRSQTTGVDRLLPLDAVTPVAVYPRGTVMAVAPGHSVPAGTLRVVLGRDASSLPYVYLTADLGAEGAGGHPGRTVQTSVGPTRASAGALQPTPLRVLLAEDVVILPGGLPFKVTATTLPADVLAPEDVLYDVAPVGHTAPARVITGAQVLRGEVGVRAPAQMAVGPAPAGRYYVPEAAVAADTRGRDYRSMFPPADRKAVDAVRVGRAGYPEDAGPAPAPAVQPKPEPVRKPAAGKREAPRGAAPDVKLDPEFRFKKEAMAAWAAQAFRESADAAEADAAAKEAVRAAKLARAKARKVPQRGLQVADNVLAPAGDDPLVHAIIIGVDQEADDEGHGPVYRVMYREDGESSRVKGTVASFPRDALVAFPT